MQDKDAAYTLPDGGDMSIWNNSTTYGAQSLAHPTQQQAREQGSSYHILVVEDDSSLANLEAGILEAHGYVVSMVGTYYKCYAHILEHLYCSQALNRQ